MSISHAGSPKNFALPINSRRMRRRCNSRRAFAWAFRSMAARSASAWPLSRSRSEEHTSELQSLMRISYAVFCLKTKKLKNTTHQVKPRLLHYTPTYAPYELTHTSYNSTRDHHTN